MRIGELASRSGVSERSLRYYEAQELIVPQRNSSGHRVYAAADLEAVVQIQELFAAGFCSSVIRQLLPELGGTGALDAATLQGMFDAAQARLEHEKREIEGELDVLHQLRGRLGVAPDTHVKADHVEHEHSLATTAAFDHRDRRLR
jgi:DNA-binding transcriptional MerR regulator